jgi:5-enolpyruvylshikimate-3-phosphate synthase
VLEHNRERRGQGFRAHLLGAVRNVALRVGPRHTGDVREVLLDPHGDRRMAFAFALFGLSRPGVLVKDARCVNKSWPGFWTELQRLGARVQ